MRPERAMSLQELKKRIDVIEESYEFMLAYAAQGLDGDEGSKREDVDEPQPFDLATFDQVLAGEPGDVVGDQADRTCGIARAQVFDAGED